MAQGAAYTFNPDFVDGLTVRDVAGYFLHGTITGSAAIDAGGKYGQGLLCTGGAMRVANINEFLYPVNTDGGISFAAWVKLSDNTAAARCIGSGTSSGSLNWAVYASNASGNVEVQISGVTYSTTTSIRDGAYHHVMLVLDTVSASHTVTIYVDGVSVLATAATAVLDYTGSVTMELGRNALSATEALNGIVDDVRWWNDPVEGTYIPTILAAEQTDFQLAIYPFDTDDGSDISTYAGRDLAIAPSATFGPAIYGRAISSTAAAAGAAGTIDFPDCDRLCITGWLRADALPVVGTAPILAITSTGGLSRVRVVLNTNGTITATWVTINYGTLSVTSTATAPVGSWSRIQVAMNPTFIGIRLNGPTEVQLPTGNAVPHLEPTVDSLNKLYIGGDVTSGGQVTWDYVTLTRNFINDTARYWAGPPAIAEAPGNVPRGAYAMNENTGTTVGDRSPSANHMTLATAGSWITGIEGSAVGASGTGPGAQKTSGLLWDAAPRGWAFSGWFKCRSGSDGARILVWRNSSQEVAHAFYLSGFFEVRIFDSTGNTGIVSPNGSPPVTAETWTHLACSCNGMTIQYFNTGRYYGEFPYTQGALQQPNQFYVGGDAGGEGSVADVDDLYTFDAPISEANVAWLFRHTGQFYLPSQQGFGVLM